MEALARWAADNAAQLMRAVEASRAEMRTKGSTWDPNDSIAVRVDFRKVGNKPLALINSNYER
jgi:hypothetical protein